jgi:hypothetical protein
MHWSNQKSVSDSANLAAGTAGIRRGGGGETPAQLKFWVEDKLTLGTWRQTDV